MKREAAQTVVVAIHKVLSGGIYFSDAISLKMLNMMAGNAIPAEAADPMALSDRELEVFRLVGQGLGTKEIALRLHLSGKTIDPIAHTLKKSWV